MKTTDTEGHELAVNDVVQIIDDKHHWFPALLTVDELKGWGVMAYMIQVTSNDPNVPNGNAYIRIKSEQIARVGTAKVITQEVEDNDDTNETTTH